MRRKKPLIVAVVAAYNEGNTVGKVVSDLARYVKKIIVVDDGSSDNTYLKARHKKVIILRHLINLGQGAALQTGFEYAKKLNPDVVVTFDADGQFTAKDITKFIPPIIFQKYDVVLGSRFLGKTINMSFTRRVILKLGVFFTYIFSNIALTDTHNGFRAFSANILHLIELHHNRSAHASEIIDQISKHKLKFLEVPVTVRYTKYSTSKGQRNINALRIPFELITKALTNQ